jgi:hypothetical protein
VVLVQSLSIALHSLAGISAALAALMYLLPVSVIGVCLWLLMRQPRQTHAAFEVSARA